MQLSCAALLFDLDGVLVDSWTVIQRHWRQWADHHGIPFERVMAVAHGRRSVEIIRIVAPHLDAEDEAHRYEAQEGNDMDGLRIFEAALPLLRALPAHAWAVVTSATRQTAATRLRYGGFPIPIVLVTADDVRRGKPDPEGYLLAAKRLGVESAECVVIEDAPAGVEAAHRAGMRAVAVATTHGLEELREAEAVVRGLSDVEVSAEDGRLQIRLKPI